MKLYSLVQNNTVVNGPVPLPLNLEEKSDFELLELGWYYTDCIRPSTFIDQFEIMLPMQFEIKQTKVICTFLKRNKTEEELTEQNLKKQQNVELDKLNRLSFADTFMRSEEYNTLSEYIKHQWIVY